MSDEQIVDFIKARQEKAYRDWMHWGTVLLPAAVRCGMIRESEYKALGKFPPFELPQWCVSPLNVKEVDFAC